MLKTILTITFACILSTVQGMPPCAISNPSVSNAAAVTVSSKATCDHEYKLLGKHANAYTVLRPQYAGPGQPQPMPPA